MTRIKRLADRMLSTFVPHATAAAALCWTDPECRLCAANKAKYCLVQYCDGVIRGGFCNQCDSC